jgi:hypothetical protein
MIRFVGFIAATVAFFTISSVAYAQYDEPALGTGTKTVEIVIENATKGQVFSPGVFASHRSGVKLWAEGEPASLGLRLLAEDGNIDPFMASDRAKGQATNYLRRRVVLLEHRDRNQETE